MKDLRRVKHLNSLIVRDQQIISPSDNVTAANHDPNNNTESINYQLFEVFDTYKDINDPFLNLRTHPDRTAEIVAKMSGGTQVIVLEKKLGTGEKWWKIRIKGDIQEGYAHSRYLKKVD